MTPEQIERATTIRDSKHMWRRRRNIQTPGTEPIKSPHECVKCGLGKGTMMTRPRFHVTVYFSKEKVLSVNKVPFFCSGIWNGGFPQISSNIDFICEAEFKV